MSWSTFLEQRRGILGMNARNLDYIRPYNPASAKRYADRKLLCKRLLIKHQLPVSRLIGSIKNSEQLESFDWNTLPISFALKPNRGFGGEGILVVYGKKKFLENTWVKADGSLITVDDLKSHIRNILDGSFSLSNTSDFAFFEERIKLAKIFKPYAFKGIPDIRVIVFNSVPIMAMLRLPTRESGGRANLKQGAIGVGIDLASGVTTTAIWKQSRIIEYLPGSGFPLSGIVIPQWKEILHMAVEAQRVSGLGFLGADIAIDRDQGPVFLELNARPGLAIQVANLDGLKARLERVSGLKIKTIGRGVRVGMNLFGGEIQEEVEEISGRKIIGVIEPVRLIGKNAKSITIEAKIDTGAGFSSIDDDLAAQLGFADTVAAFRAMHSDYSKVKHLTPIERRATLGNIPDLAGTTIIKSSHGVSYRPMVRVTLLLGGIEINTKVSIIDRESLKYPAIIGRRNLNAFLVDVKK
ncbi:MAG: sugar-transfer associated ATP-grasp domain-containing protein [Candidatus Moraniibacteriota bacterium]